MSYHDEEYQHGLVVSVVRELLFYILDVEDEALRTQICDGLQAMPYSELRHLSQDQVMVKALQNHPGLLVKWHSYWECAKVRAKRPDSRPLIVPGLIVAPVPIRPIDDPAYFQESLRALMASSFFVKKDKNGKESYELRSVDIVARN